MGFRVSPLPGNLRWANVPVQCGRGSLSSPEGGKLGPSTYRHHHLVVPRSNSLHAARNWQVPQGWSYYRSQMASPRESSHEDHALRQERPPAARSPLLRPAQRHCLDFGGKNHSRLPTAAPWGHGLDPANSHAPWHQGAANWDKLGSCLIPQLPGKWKSPA